MRYLIVDALKARCVSTSDWLASWRLLASLVASWRAGITSLVDGTQSEFPLDCIVKPIAKHHEVV
jgi:hypothetical protein